MVVALLTLVLVLEVWWWSTGVGRVVVEYWCWKCGIACNSSSTGTEAVALLTLILVLRRVALFTLVMVLGG